MKAKTTDRAVRMNHLIMITDVTGRIEYVNPKFTEVTGYAAVEVIGKNPRFLSSGRIPFATYEGMWRTLLGGGEWRGEFHNRRKNGDAYRESAVISAVCDEGGIITHFVAVKEDLTGRDDLETWADELETPKEEAVA